MLALEEADDLFPVRRVTGAPRASALRINLYVEQADRAKGSAWTNHATAKTVPDWVGLDAIYRVYVTARIGRGVGLDPAAGPDLINFWRGMILGKAVFGAWWEARKRLTWGCESNGGENGECRNGEETNHDSTCG